MHNYINNLHAPLLYIVTMTTTHTTQTFDGNQVGVDFRILEDFLYIINIMVLK